MSEQQQGESRSSAKEEEFDEAIEGEVEVLESASPRSRPSSLPLILAGVALAAVIAVLIFGYRYWLDMKATLEQLDRNLVVANQQQSQFAERLKQSRQAIDQQQQQIAAQKEELAQQAERIRQAKEAAKQQDTQLYRSLSEIQTRLGGREGQWRVAEAEYLLRVANHRLSLMGDARTSIEALKSADERLSDSGDPIWSEVREQIAREMTQLKAVPVVDQAGISAELSALSDQVDRLPLRDEGYALTPAAIADEQQKEAIGEEKISITQIIDDFWQGFKSMMVIRHHDRPISAMLPPEQRYFLMQNLRLKIENAKAALMGRETSLYKDNLNSTLKWLEAYFLTDASEVTGFRNQIQALLTRNIAPDLPDITGSLRLLQEKRQQLNQEGGQ